MRKIKYITSLFSASVLLVGCNETLEDTYSNVTDGGKIRYVAKCSDMRANAGWERLVVEWKNGTDATIDKIKLVWTYDGKKDSVLLEPLTTKYVLNNLSNKVYRFDIIALDKAGNKSLSETTYGRPYTKEHEVMNAFTRGVTKAYFVKDKMVFFTDRWNDDIIEMKLKYKDSDGNTKYYDFDESTAGKLITIDNISMNPDDVVYVLRKGRFEDSVDEIEFDPYPISRLKNYSSGFINAIERRYGYSTRTKEDEIRFEKFVNEVKELEFDYNIETLEDILYCPNLEKLIFGKNRYLSGTYNNKFRSVISGNVANSKLIVEKAKALQGLTIEYYGDTHYFTPAIAGSVNKQKPVLPKLSVIGMDAFREYDNGNLILCTPSDPYAELNNLLDDDFATRWEPTSIQRVRNYEMLMELKKVTQLGGVKIKQPSIMRGDTRTPSFMTKIITMYTSIDGITWQKVTYFDTNILGYSSEEVTLLQFPEGKRDVKYVKVLLQDCVDNGGNCTIILGDIVLFE